MKALRLKLQGELADWKAAETQRIDGAFARLAQVEARVQEQGASSDTAVDALKVDFEGRVRELVKEEKAAFQDHNREVEARIVEQLCGVQALMESSLGEQRSAIDLAETLRGELDGLAASVMVRMDAYEDP